MSIFFTKTGKPEYTKKWPKDIIYPFKMTSDYDDNAGLYAYQVVYLGETLYFASDGYKLFNGDGGYNNVYSSVLNTFTDYSGPGSTFDPPDSIKPYCDGFIMIMLFSFKVIKVVGYNICKVKDISLAEPYLGMPTKFSFMAYDGVMNGNYSPIDPINNKWVVVDRQEEPDPSILDYKTKYVLNRPVYSNWFALIIQSVAKPSNYTLIGQLELIKELGDR